MIEPRFSDSDFYFYKKRARDPRSWHGAAIMNYELAKFLNRKYNSAHQRLIYSHSGERKTRISSLDLALHRYIMMFYGLHLENLFKGLLVANGRDPIEFDKNGMPHLSQKFITHNLSALFKESLEIEPNTEESEAMERLKRAVLSGKYSVESRPSMSFSYVARLRPDIKIANNISRKCLRKFKSIYRA